MKNTLLSLMSLIFMLSCGFEIPTDALKAQSNNLLADQYLAEPKKEPAPPPQEVCPLSDLTPDIFQVDRDEPGVPFVDKNQDIKELGTKLVINDFFRTPETIYNFMKLVPTR